MAIKLNTSYSKKLGLPGYSSHAFSASVEVELGDINQAGAECARLYGLLQASVDHEIRHTGFVPDDTYGMNTSPPGTNGHPGTASGMLPVSNGNHSANGNGSTNGNNTNGNWNCSPKQRDLILKIMSENSLLQDNVDGLARQRFGVGLHQLNKLQASGLIDELLESFGGRGKNRNGAPAPAGAAMNGGRS